MSSQIENFLSSRLPIVGLVGYSLQSSEGVISSQCFSKSLYPTSIEQMLNSLIETGRALLPPGEQTAQYCWTFEYLLVYVAARADGFCLAFMVENNPGVQMVRIQEALQAFGEMIEM